MLNNKNTDQSRNATQIKIDHCICYLCTQVSHWAQLSTTRPHHPSTSSTYSWVLPSYSINRALLLLKKKKKSQDFENKKFLTLRLQTFRILALLSTCPLHCPAPGLRIRQNFSKLHVFPLECHGPLTGCRAQTDTAGPDQLHAGNLRASTLSLMKWAALQDQLSKGLGI